MNEHFASLIVNNSDCFFVYRLYTIEIERSSSFNQLLGVGIGVFQGLSNITLNGSTVVDYFSANSMPLASVVTSCYCIEFTLLCCHFTNMAITKSKTLRDAIDTKGECL